MSVYHKLWDFKTWQWFPPFRANQAHETDLHWSFVRRLEPQIPAETPLWREEKGSTAIYKTTGHIWSWILVTWIDYMVLDLLETNSLHLKMDWWNTIVSFWDGLYSGARLLVSGSVHSWNFHGNLKMMICMISKFGVRFIPFLLGASMFRWTSRWILAGTHVLYGFVPS